MDMGYKADRTLGYFQFAAGAFDTAATLASKLPGGVIPDGTSLIIVSPEAQAIRYRDDGTPPTTLVGMPVAVGVTLRYTGQNMPGLQIVSAVAGSIVNVIFYAQ